MLNIRDRLCKPVIYRRHISNCEFGFENDFLPKYKLIYVKLYDPLTKREIKEGFIPRTQWKKYKRNNPIFVYNGKYFWLSDFNPHVEYLTSINNGKDYSKVL